MKNKKKKLNKRGFTMVELLATIVILSILLTTAIVAVSRVITKSKVTQEKQQKNSLEMAAKSYFEMNREKLPKEIGEVKRVYAYELKTNKYLKDNLKDASGKDCTGSGSSKKSYVRVYKYDKNEYNYTTYLYCGSTAPDPESESIQEPTIEILPINNNQLTIIMNGSKDAPIYGYSFTIIANNQEVYNSGTLSAGKKESLTITKSLTDYVNLTEPTIIKVQASARSINGGYSEDIQETQVEATNNTTIQDNQAPSCEVISGQAVNDNDWIKTAGQERKITVKCIDEGGSGCVRNTYTRTWPKDTEKYVKTGYIEIEDNAGNKYNCPVRVNIDIR